MLLKLHNSFLIGGVKPQLLFLLLRLKFPLMLHQSLKVSTPRLELHQRQNLVFVQITQKKHGIELLLLVPLRPKVCLHLLDRELAVCVSVSFLESFLCDDVITSTRDVVFSHLLPLLLGQKLVPVPVILAKLSIEGFCDLLGIEAPPLLVLEFLVVRLAHDFKLRLAKNPITVEICRRELCHASDQLFLFPLGEVSRGVGDIDGRQDPQ
mmetsp:Transcript_31339/g.61202  ORF Transcript_31339/g.61202 Transcript_31339/m.61202 type:complete len:209 (-) Transcript_31339:38-664(-)